MIDRRQGDAGVRQQGPESTPQPGITRRDFLNGVAVTVGATLLPAQALLAAEDVGRSPCSPGLDCKSQFRAGRAELLATPFSTFESEIRRQLTALLGPGGFDAGRDIQAITVNRWPHGYAYGYNELFEPLDQRPDERPCVRGRRPFGNIAIANSDAAGYAYTDAAIDEAHRAVSELLAG